MDQNPQGNTPVKQITRPPVKCWVPGCSSSSDKFPMKTFFSLPNDPLLRDVWLASTGKKYYLPLQNICFCEDHFVTNEETTEFPVYKMPLKICRICLRNIEDKKYCILSSKIKSKMPDCVEQIFGCASAVPLIEVLQYCIPEMTIEMNPLPVTCDSCYRKIWIYYLFKKKCMYKEKEIEEEYFPGRYGSLVGCRACPSTDYTNLVSLHENTELGDLLNSMLTNCYSSSIVPLKLCLACESVLEGIQAFRRDFSLAQKYFKQISERPTQHQANQDRPTVIALKEVDTTEKQVQIAKLMLEKGLGLKDKHVSEAHQTNIWNTIQTSFMQYGCNFSIQNLKDTWAMIILEYTLGRLKGTELGDVLSEYMKAESPKPISKPLKKRYRAPSTPTSRDLSFDASNNVQAAKQNVTSDPAVVPCRIIPEPIGIFEPNIIPPPNPYGTTTALPPYALSNADGSDTSTITCSPVVGGDTADSVTVENCAPGLGYQASFNHFLLNKGIVPNSKSTSSSVRADTGYIAKPSDLSENMKSFGLLPTSSSSLNKIESAKVTVNESSPNLVIHSGTGQNIPLMSVATKCSTTTAPGIKAVESHRRNTGGTALEIVEPDPSEYPQKVEQEVENSCYTATSTILVIQSAIPSTSNVVIDLTEDEDKMVQVANISSSWEELSPDDTAANAEESQESGDIEISTNFSRTSSVEVAKEPSTSIAEKTNDIRPLKQPSTKSNEVDIEQSKKTTEISRISWNRMEDMKFLDAFIVQFENAKGRPMKDIWRNLKNEANLPPTKATSLEAYWFDLVKSYNEKSLNLELSEKMSHCMKLWTQHKDVVRNGSKQTDCDDKNIILVKKMIQFLHESDVFDESWKVVLLKMSAYEEFAGYNYVDLRMHWKTLYHRFKFQTGGPVLRADLKEEFASLLGLIKKLKLRNFWDTRMVNGKRVSSEVSPFASLNRRKKMSKGIVKSRHQSFSFQDKIDLVDAMKCEYEVSTEKGVLSVNPWKTILSKLHRVKYGDWDENRLWRMWAQMRLSAKIHAKDGSDYVDTEVWNLLEKHNNYLKNRKNGLQNPGSSSFSPEKKSDKQNELEQKSNKQDDEVMVACASVDTPTKKVQTLISSFCTVEKSDKKIDPATKAESSTSCASAVEQTDYKSSYSRGSVELKKPSEAKMDILTIEIDSDSDFSDGNDDSRDPAAKVPLSPNVKSWTESEKNMFFKSVKTEIGVMIKNDENISNPWKNIIKRLQESQYSMYSLKELEKVWRKIRMDAHLHENNNAMFVTPLDTEVNRLIKLLNSIKEAKRISKLTKAKPAEKLEDKNHSETNDSGKSKSAAPEKKKRKKRPLTIARTKKDKKPKLALPPVDPNRLEEDKEEAERIAWSDNEQKDLIGIIETSGNEVFKPDVPKQFWNKVRTKLVEKGYSERSVGALYYKWNRLLESAKMAWADQKVMNDFDKAVIGFLTEVIKRNVKKTYGPENEETKDATTSNLPEEIMEDKQQSEPHSVDQNKSGSEVTCDKSSSADENNEECTIKENMQENTGSEQEEEETEDYGNDSEDEYVSAADIMKM